MRENIGLFRGKRKDNGEWVCGDLVHSWENMNAKPDIQIHNNMGYFDVIPETVGECTNVPDKNGKFIFEGDILRFYDVETKHESNGYAVIHYGRFRDTDAMSDFDYLGWYLTITTIPNEATTIFVIEDEGLAFEVIGNVTDNPELLRGAD